MTTVRFQFAMVAVLVAASLTFPWLRYRQTQRDQTERAQALQRQTQQLAELSAENQRLSNLVAQSRPAALPDDQQRELLKLRGEMGRLRLAAREAEQLRAANQMLLASPAPPQERSPQRPDPAAVLAYWPKDQLTRAGYADPQSALKTFLWAISRGDWESLYASITVPEDARAEFQEMVKTEAGKAEGRKLAESFAPYTAFYVVGQRTPSENRAILDVYFEGDGKTRKVAIEKTGQEWKFKNMGRPGQEDGDLENGSWP